MFRAHVSPSSEQVTLCNSCLFSPPVMSFPAEGIESAYKNSIDDVREFLEAKYPENYIVVNVSPRSYRMDRLNDRVSAACWYEGLLYWN